MNAVAIEDLKENDVVLVNRPVSENGGTTHRFYLGRVVERSHYALLKQRATSKELVMLDTWVELECDGEHAAEELVSFLHFEKDEPEAVAQLIGKWNPETRQVEPV